MGWSTQAAAILSLRSLIFDGPTDKICSTKKVLGPIDGVNVSFKTFEYRRLTDFTTAAAPFGVQKNGVPLTGVAISADDKGSGLFTLASAPSQTGRDVITATYYYQWFFDTDLDVFLQNSSTWLGFNTNYQNIPDGLNASALRFAAQEAYEACAMKYSSRMSEVYKLEDAPDETILKSIEAFHSMADGFMDKARTLRDDYYTRQGQSLAPLFNLSTGRVTDPTPRR